MLTEHIYKIISQLLSTQTDGVLPRMPCSMLSIFVRYVQETQGKPILVLSADDETHRTLLHDLPGSSLLPESAIMPSAFLPPHLKTKRDLFRTLMELAEASVPITIAHPSALVPRLPGAAEIRNMFRRVETGTMLDIRQLGSHLGSVGYEAVDVVRVRGQYARRGDILDVFPIDADAPLRIQVDFDRLESLRRFDTVSQRSMDIISTLMIPPVNLFVDTAGNRERLSDGFSTRFNDPGLSLSLQEKREQIDAGNLEGMDHYFHLAWSQTGWPDLFLNHFVIVDGPGEIQQSWESYHRQVAMDHDDAVPRGYIALDPSRDMVSIQDLSRLLDGPRTLRLEHPSHAFGLHRQSPGGSLKAVLTGIRSALDRGHTILGTRGDAECERLGNLLFEHAVPFTKDVLRVDAVLLRPVPLRAGFSIDDRFTYLAAQELFPSARRPAQRSPSHTPFFSDFSDIRTGDYVVHVDYGIAQYTGLRIVAVAEAEEECLELTFRGNARVMLPVSKLHLLQKYQNAAGGDVQLSSLRSNTWHKLKKRVGQEVARYAEELLHLYAERRLAAGIGFGPDSLWQRDFESTFPYDETDDQIRAIDDIKQDMESDVPMDRLLCGDVGFGKTEVAMRAAFKAVDGGRQVMVLAPTTVLAFQHLQTFTHRFSRFPIRIDMLSRFVEPPAQKTVVEQFRTGEIDILIGTHRIFSRDILPKKLGLLIVDEEQKFGVLHKEKLKMLRKNIDVLSLSATPIPRTLNMSVMGLKDVSIIESPPRDRLAINTYHIPFDPLTISEAIQFELKRGGQVYVVNNHVKTIDTLADAIRGLTPQQTRIAVAHGQMPEKELEAVMLAFFKGDIDILVCTAIIENGMDVPRANTMLINEAQAFGLSQLYQLRGRIGRSDRAAYAYLITPGKHALTEDARKRLQALEDFSHLGAGFRIAMLDLELRGAGEILGDRQSGHIQSVGFELYLQMLEDAVRKLKADGGPVAVETVLEMGTIGVIPGSYVGSASVRLAFYRRLAMAHEPDKLAGILEELVDRFGPLPEETNRLICGHRVRLAARRLSLESVTFRGRQAILVPGPAHQMDISRLIAIIPEMAGATLDPSGQLTIQRPQREPASEFILRIQRFLLQLSPQEING